MKRIMAERTVPFLAETLCALLVPSALRHEVLGDLEEEYWQLVERREPGFARRWYWEQAFRSIPPMVRRRAVSAISRLAGVAGSQVPVDENAPYSSRIGRWFFVAAIAWIVSIALLKQPQPTEAHPPTWPIVNLPNGASFAVYFPRRQDAVGGAVIVGPTHAYKRASSDEALHSRQERLTMTLLATPFGVAIGALAWLAARQIWTFRVARWRAAGGNAAVAGG